MPSTFWRAYERQAGRGPGVCYCYDCQAFAHFLVKSEEILDDRGGSEVIQVLPSNVTLTEGVEALACVRLTAKGLLRSLIRSTPSRRGTVQVR